MNAKLSRRSLLCAALGTALSACMDDDTQSAAGGGAPAGAGASPAKGAASALTSLVSAPSSGAMLGGVNVAGLEFNSGALPGVCGTDYCAPDPAEIAYYRARGAKTLRLPFLWERLQPALGGPLDTSYAAMIDAVVDQAKQLGMSVLLDAHQYGRRQQGGQSCIIGQTGAVTSAHFAAFWRAVGERYRTSPVIFNLTNEPHDQDGPTLVAVQNEAIAAIRAAGANQLVLVSGLAWSGAHSWVTSGNADLMQGVSDPGNNFAFDVHQYLDPDSSGTSGACVSGAGLRLTAFTAWAKQHGKRGYLGEFAGDASGGCANELSTMLNHMRGNHDVWIGWTWWAGGQWWPASYPFALRPASLANPVDRPQMSLLQGAW